VANPKQPILIDTCVLLDDPDVIVRIRGRDGIPFLTGTVLAELDYNKKGDEQINKNARAIFRELNSQPTAKPLNMPTGKDLLDGDILTRFSFGDGPVFLIGRETFRSDTNNDGKIIEIAKDYGMLLLTRDGAMKVRADTIGVTVVLWTGPKQAPNPTVGPNANLSTRKYTPRTQAAVASTVTPFLLPISPITERDQSIPVSTLPGETGVIKTESGRTIHLGTLISAGGEGSIYQTPISGEVCKIYHRDKLTLLRRKKIELMVSRKILRSGISWPTELALNEDRQFVGFLMPRASGKTVQSTMFVKPVLEKTFPGWRRHDLLKLCIAFIEHVQYLHSLNVIVGDINPMNLLVTEDSSKLWIVDTDSFQIESFPCPVGTVNFTAPEIQGRSYSDYLRTKDHEYFAVATMLFMILHPGKPPYSQQGGGSPSDNIKAMDFPYWFRDDDQEFGGKNAPHGPWQNIWSHLPYHVKEAFHLAFRKNRRASIDEWLRICRKYLAMLERGQVTPEIFPKAFKIKDPIDVPCGKCSTPFTASKPWVDKLAQQGKLAWCPECTNRVKLERLASQSLRDTNQAQRQNQAPKSSYNPYIRPSQSSGQSTRVPPRQTASSGRGQYLGGAKASNRDGLFVSILKFLFK